MGDFYGRNRGKRRKSLFREGINKEEDRRFVWGDLGVIRVLCYGI